MDIQVEPVNFNSSQDLINHMESLFRPLSKYHDRITSLHVYMESVNHEKSDKLIKIKALVPGHELFLQDSAGDFVSAAQSVFDKMKRQLSDLKDRDKDNQQIRPDKVY